jgi:hypothetical protein
MGLRTIVYPGQAYIRDTLKAGVFSFPSIFESDVATAATTWNPSDKGPNIALSNGNLTAILTTTPFGSVRATTSNTPGYYFEVTYSAVSNGSIGIANSSAAVTFYMGADTNSLGYNNAGQCFYGGANIGTGATWGVGDVMGLYYSASSQVKFYKNGVLTFTSSSVPTGSPLYAASTPATAGDRNTANFGATAFSALPSGAIAWDSSLAAPFIFPRSRHYVRR